MDHTPGQRQFSDIKACQNFYKGKYGYNDQQMSEFVDLSIHNFDIHAEQNTKYVFRTSAYK